MGRFRAAYGDAYSAPAEVGFTVPHVAPGRYVIEYCNSPCDGVFGEPDANWDTEVTIVATPAEARLNVEIDRLESKLTSLIWREDAWERRNIRSLRDSVLGPGGIGEETEALKVENASARRRAEALEARLDRLGSGAGRPSWVAYGAGAVALAALFVAGLRRRSGQPAPDPQPWRAEDAHDHVLM